MVSRIVSRSTVSVNTNISASLFAPSGLHTDRLVLRRPLAGDAAAVRPLRQRP